MGPEQADHCKEQSGHGDLFRGQWQPLKTISVLGESLCDVDSELERETEPIRRLFPIIPKMVIFCIYVLENKAQVGIIQCMFGRIRLLPNQCVKKIKQLGPLTYYLHFPLFFSSSSLSKCK